MRRFLFAALPVLLILFSDVSAELSPSWSWSYPGLSGSPVTDLVFDGGTQIWAASGPNVLHSNDAGASWSLAHTFDSDRRLTSLIRLASGDLMAALDNGELVRSGDGGSTWTTDPTVTGAAHVVEITPGVLSTAGTSYWRSTDGGATWAPLSLPGGAQDQHWFDANMGVLLVSGSVVRTTDGGGTWNVVLNASPNSGPRMDFNGLEGIVNGEDDDVYVSTDGGATWTARFVPFTYVSQEWLPMWACMALGSGRFIATKTDGFFGYVETLDGGLTWTFATDVQPWVLTRSGSDLYMGSGGNAIYRSTDDGVTWSDLTAPAGRPDLAYLSMAPPFGLSASGTKLLRTNDTGMSWQASTVSVADIEGVGVRDASIGFVGGDAGDVARTLDGGATWTAELLPLVARGGGTAVVAFEFPPGDHVYALTRGALSTVYHSAASGNTWERRDTGLPSGYDWIQMEFATATKGFVLDRLSGEVWRTFDGGLSWSLAGGAPVSTPAPYDRFEARGTSELYMVGPPPCDVCPGEGLWRSTDDATTWTEVVPGISYGYSLREADGVLYVGFDIGSPSISYSEDGGETFQSLYHNLEALCCYPTLPPIAVAGYGGFDSFSGGIAVFGSYTVIEIADLSVVDVPTGAVDTGLTLQVLQPVGERFDIAFTIPTSTTPELDVFDVQGRRVRSVSASPVRASEAVSVAWEGRDTLGRQVEPGVYYVRLRAGAAAVTERVVLVR